MKIHLAARMQRLFRLVGLDVQRNSPLWHDTPDFASLMKDIRARTIVSDDRCFMLYQYVRLVSHLPGSMAEVGVYRGGTARLIAKACPTKTLHLFDTFDGLPPTAPGIDRMPTGHFADASLESVRTFLGSCGNAVVHPGLFPDTAQAVEQKGFSFVHLDADLYRSTMDGLEFFYPRLALGGVIVVDDYGWKDCPGVQKAVREFLENKIELPLVARRYQGVILKTASTTEESMDRQ